MLLAQSSLALSYADQLLSTEDSKMKKLEMAIGTELKAIFACILLQS